MVSEPFQIESFIENEIYVKACHTYFFNGQSFFQAQLRVSLSCDFVASRERSANLAQFVLVGVRQCNPVDIARPS